MPFESGFVFNIVWAGSVFPYLRHFVGSQLRHSDARFRFVANGCAPDQMRLMEEFAAANAPRVIEVFVSSESMERHGTALEGALTSPCTGPTPSGRRWRAGAWASDQQANRRSLGQRWRRSGRPARRTGSTTRGRWSTSCFRRMATGSATLEHAPLLHIGGLSHYLSPPEKGGRGARCGRGAGPAVALAAGPAGGGPSHGVGASGAVRGAARSRGTVGPRRGSRRSAGLRAPRADRALRFEWRSGRSRRRLGARGLRCSGDGVRRRPDPRRVLHHERDPTPSIDR
jgi:hypothetical protein